MKKPKVKPVEAPKAPVAVVVPIPVAEPPKPKEPEMRIRKLWPE
jgi:hypothetical protein